MCKVSLKVWVEYAFCGISHIGGGFALFREIFWATRPIRCNDMQSVEAPVSDIFVRGYFTISRPTSIQPSRFALVLGVVVVVVIIIIVFIVVVVALIILILIVLLFRI